MSQYCNIHFAIIILLCDVQIKYSLSVLASPGHVFMSQGATSFQFTIPDHSNGRGRENSEHHLTLSEKVQMMLQKKRLNNIEVTSSTPSVQLRPPKKFSCSPESGDPALKCTSSKSAIRTRQVEEFSPRLLPRPISPVGPDMVLPIPRLIFPRHVSNSGESTHFHDEHQLANFVNSPKPTQFRFQEENLSPKFLEHQNEFHPMKSDDIFNQIRHQSSSRGPSDHLKQSSNRPSFNNQANRSNFSSGEHPSVTYAQFMRARAKLIQKPSSSSETFRNFGPDISTRPRQITNLQKHSSHENIPVKRFDKPWHRQENSQTNPNFSVFFQRLPKGSSHERQSHQNSKELERPRFNSNEIEHPNIKTSENRLQNSNPEPMTPNNHGNHAIANTKIDIREQERIANPTAPSQNISSGSQEIELYQKLLGYLLTKLSHKNSTHKNIFSDIK